MKPIEIVSLDFVLLVLSTVIIYYALTPRAQTIWLLIVSYFFYATWRWSYVAVLLIFTILNFFLGVQIEKTKSRGLLLLGIVINAGALSMLKFLVSPYAVNILGRINATTLTSILLPIGFSFYILQTISYIIDIQRGQLKAERDFIHLALYLAYFPKMLAGPIERAKNFLPQLKQARLVDKNAIEQGLYLILLGLLRKVVIADQLSRLRPTDIFSKPENYTSLEQAVWLFVFTFIIYNDFAGYTSIIRGVSCFLGIQLSPNFRQPFLARSFSDFWTRWHISLSEWLRDYIFYPVRRWLLQNQWSGWTASIIPSMFTLLVSGFWHGAFLALLLWGFLHGIYLFIEQLLQQSKLLPKDGYQVRLYSIFVFIMVTLAWVPFNTPSVRSAGRYLLGLLPPYSAEFNLYILTDFLLIFFSFWIDWQEQRHNDLAFPRKWTAAQQSWSVAIAVILICLFINAGNDLSHFVYQFF